MTKTAFCVLSVSIFCGVVGCASDGEMPPIEPSRQELPDFAAVLRDAESDAQRADSVVPCGTGSCDRSSCGFACAAGQLCEPVCSAGNDRYESYVLFNISGSASARLDSRDTPYRPVLRLEDTLWYGTDLWRFSETRNGLSIQYSDIKVGAFLASDPYDLGAQVEIYTRDFKGPGDYVADVSYRANAKRRSDGTFTAAPRYVKAGGCNLRVANEGTKLTGTFTCASVPSAEGGSVNIDGSFASTATAVDGPIMVAKSHE